MKLLRIGLLATIGLLGRSLDAADLVIEVDAGAHDRLDTPLRIELPRDPAESYPFSTLEALDSGQLVNGQTNSGELTWKLDAPLPAGSKRRYRLKKGATPVNHLEFADHPDIIPLKLDGRTVFAYHKTITKPPAGIDPVYQRSGFIHPLATRSGLVVTDDFSPEHPHQHGLFFAWVNTTFDGRKVDFWNQLGRTGRVGNDTERPGPTFIGGPFAAEFHASLRHEDLTAPTGPVPVLLERWAIHAYDVPGVVVFDFESEMKCAGDKPLKLNQYIYGGLGYRGNRQWNDPTVKGTDAPDPSKSGHSDFLTSEGKRRANGNHTRPRWVDLSGEVDGKVGGLTILGHPTNFRYPQPVRLHPNMPYLSFAPEFLGAFEIVPGQSYVSRYRLIAHDGPPDPKLIDRIWDDYADPPKVRIVAD